MTVLITLAVLTAVITAALFYEPTRSLSEAPPGEFRETPYEAEFYRRRKEV